MTEIQDFLTEPTSSEYHYSLHHGADSQLEFGWQAKSFGAFKEFTTEFFRDTNRVISPIIWREGERLKINFTGADWYALDHDDGSITLKDAQQKYGNLAGVIYTTKSHLKEKGARPACERFRVMTGLSRTVNMMEFYRIGRFFAKVLGHDSQAIDGARAFRCNDFAVVHQLTGIKVWNVDAILKYCDEHNIQEMSRTQAEIVPEPELEIEEWRGWSREERINRYRDNILSDTFPDSIEGNEGSNALLLACAVRIGYAVSRQDAQEVIEEYNRLKCDPEWSSAEIAHKFDSAVYDGKPGDRLPASQKSIDAIREMLHANPANQPKPSADKVVLPAIQKNFGITRSGRQKPPELWEDMLYQGHKMIVSGASKSYKTWMAMGLGLSIAAGIPYWGKKTSKAKVLYVNLELDDVFFEQDRILPALHKLGLAPSDVSGYWDVLNLRGFAAPAEQIVRHIIKTARSEKYGLIILDPLYKLIAGLDENSAGDMGSVCIEFDRLAHQSQASVLLIHHFSKGLASTKQMMDRSSGSGVFARDPDTALYLSPHEEEEAMIVDGVWRYHKRGESFVVRWDYPLLTVDPILDPTKERTRQRNGGIDLEMNHILRALRPAPASKAEIMEQIRKDVPFRNSAFEALFNTALHEQLIKADGSKKTGGRSKMLYSLAPDGIKTLTGAAVPADPAPECANNSGEPEMCQ